MMILNQLKKIIKLLLNSAINKILEKNNFLNKECFYAGRKEAASTATGLYKRHIIEQEEFINYVLND